MKCPECNREMIGKFNNLRVRRWYCEYCAADWNPVKTFKEAICLCKNGVRGKECFDYHPKDKSPFKTVTR